MRNGIRQQSLGLPLKCACGEKKDLLSFCSEIWPVFIIREDWGFCVLFLYSKLISVVLLNPHLASCWKRLQLEHQLCRCRRIPHWLEGFLSPSLELSSQCHMYCLHYLWLPRKARIQMTLYPVVFVICVYSEHSSWHKSFKSCE